MINPQFRSARIRSSVGDRTMVKAFFLLAIFISTNLGEEEKHCLLFNGTCVSHCPRSMHPYHTRCDVDTVSQRTCEEPFVYDLGYTCGWSRCDCNADMLLDEKSQACVDYYTCTRVYKHRTRGRRRRKMKLRLPEDDGNPLA